MLAKPKSPRSFGKSPPTNSYASTNETLLYVPVDFYIILTVIVFAFSDASHNHKYPRSTDALPLYKVPLAYIALFMYDAEYPLSY